MEFTEFLQEAAAKGEVINLSPDCPLRFFGAGETAVIEGLPGFKLSLF